MAFDANTAPVSGIYTEQIMSMHDVFKPQHIPELFSRYGDQYMPMFQLFRSLGRESAIAGDEWIGHEENWYHRNIKIASSTAAGSAGQVVDVTLDAEYHDAKGNSYPRVGDVFSIPNSNFDQVRLEAKDTSTPNAHLLSLKPANSAVAIPAIPAGTMLSITNGAFAAGTGQPTGTVVGTSERHFMAQIFKETIGAEGSQLVNEKWYKITDKGKSVKGYYSPGYLRGDYLMALKIDGAFTWGDESDNLFVPQGEKGAGNKVKMTKGVMRHVKELGKTLQYTEGSWTPTDLDQVGLYLKSQGINTGYAMAFLGAMLQLDIENGMVDYLGAKSTPDYTHAVKQVFGGNEDLAASIGFSIIKKGGVKYMLKPMDVWSNPMTFGASGYNLDKYGLIIPLAKFTDPKTKKVMNNIETRYRAMDGYSRRFETWTVAGAGNGMKVSEIDETNTYFRAHLGLQAMKVNQMIMLTP